MFPEFLTMPRNLAMASCAALALFTAGVAATPAFADAMQAEATANRVISVPKDKSLSFRLDEPATKIIVSQPDVAEVVATSDRSFYVRGIEPGSTNLLIYGPGGRMIEVIDVRVGYDAKALQSDLTTALPGEDVHVQTLGEGVLLTGNVSTTGVATRAMAIAQKFAPDAATSSLIVQASQEVMLEVRVMEASRTALQDAGFQGAIKSSNFTMNFGSGLIGNTPANGIIGFASHAGLNGVDLAIQALEEKGIVRTLARPTLVAVSGGKASFLAGGEFPYPVPQGLTGITIEFRTYGVKLNFEPTVQDNGLIRLAVAPEVSQLDQTNAIKINGVQVPGLITRRADTTVEIRNGDSLAIGGLFQHDYTNDLRQYPLLGDIPILGSLFRSARWKRDETELVIVVTPHIVTARDFQNAVNAAPGVKPEPKALDFMINGKESLDKPMTRDFSDPRTTRPQLRGAIAPTAPVSGK